MAVSQRTSPARSKAKETALRILVVENHPDMRQGLKTFLEMLNCHARIVEDLRSARQAAGEEPFDVLLTDISLPDGDGWDLLGQLRAVNQLPPTAIAMSGFGSAADVLKSEKAGFVTHLVKPFQPDELESILKKAGAAPSAATMAA